MNKAFSYLLFASALGVSSLFAEDKWAAEATDVCVNLSESDIKPQIEVLPLNPGGKKAQDGMKTPLSAPAGNWYVINLPIEIKAVGRRENEKTGKMEKCAARYVDELKIKAYVLFEKRTKKKNPDPQGEDYFLLEKEVSYVDIPMERVAKKGDGFTDIKDGSGYAKMSVGLYVSPSSALKLTATPDKPEETIRVVACAIAPTFKGAPCRAIPKKDSKLTPISFVSDKKLERLLKKSDWWKGSTASHFSQTTAQLLCVSETPFAASYSPSYPAVKPMYGAPSSAAPASSAPSSTESGSTTSSAPTTSSSTSDADE